MLIINADDWGRDKAATDAALTCYTNGRISSVSAMVFMEDSERACDLAKSVGIAGVGLHLNLDLRFTSKVPQGLLAESHERVARFLRASKYALLMYHPFLRKQFRYIYEAQSEEFMRLYGRRPSHVDGHHHLHLATNILLDDIIPRGCKVRRNFSFQPGEKGLLNRIYRGFADGWLARRYKLTDFFFGLAQHLEASRFARVVQLASRANVELMTHPQTRAECDFLLSQQFNQLVGGAQLASYLLL
jgi:predicted glycoside hydrolase/deacetylase ChbG (UPF0249 family)